MDTNTSVPGIEIGSALRTAARVAGVTGLLTIAIAVFSHYAVSPQIVVAGDVAATAANIVAHEDLFRLNVVCQILHGVGVLVVTAALYTVLKPVSGGLAFLAALCRLVYGLMWILNAVSAFTALRLLSGASYLQSFEADRLQALSKVYLSAGFDAYYTGLPFYGLASMLCAWLWFKSYTIPRALAGFGVIASAWCVLTAFAFLLSPAFGKAINLYSLDSPMGAFEIGLSIWLVFRGLRQPEPRQPYFASVSETDA